MDGAPQAVIEIDVHHGIASDVEVDEVLARLVPSAHPSLTTLSHGDHVWFIASRYYAEVGLHGKRSLRDLVYIAGLLRTVEIDWDLVMRAAASHEIHAPLYYVLGFLARLGADVPPCVLDAVHPNAGSRLRDWGWQLGKLFDTVEPFPLDLSSVVDPA